uniref:Uncharacterized protein n=1 Tax=viral metagenome TaxID=1070528 RepID=A0A6C0HZU0_9ZZZZ
MDFIFIIYSCKHNLHKSILIYELLRDKLPTCKTFIVYGEPELDSDYEFRDNAKFLALKCGDFYENLCEKTITVCKIISVLFPEIKGIFKCDDDIFPNIQKINEMILYINENSIDYLGNKVFLHESNNTTHHFNKCSNESFNIGKRVHSCYCCTGPLYYLSKLSIDIISKIESIKEYFYEDIMIGHILYKYGIYPHYYKTYYDEFENIDKGCFQNYQNYKKLFVKLHGGLGNQLFQVAAAYNFSKKNNMILILLYPNENYSVSMTHNICADEFLKTIFSKFNYAIYENVDLSNVKKLEIMDCFKYDDSIIFDSDTFIYGYFQNKKYIENLKEVLSLFENRELCQQLMYKYPELENSYFIHVRRGDYLLNGFSDIYNFDKDSYYTKAIEMIYSIDANPHFFIFSDDIDFVENYPIFSSLNKTIVKRMTTQRMTIQRMTTIEEFFMMSLCRNGGICANSTFSGWASNMIRNPEKVIIVPKNWINIGYEYEIPFNYTYSL